MYVVTGGSGFLGRAVVRMLADAGQPVMRIARRDVAAEQGVIDLRVAGYHDLPHSMASSILIHAGEPADIAAAEAAGEEHIRLVCGFMDTLLARGFARLVYISSAAVYGDEILSPRRPDEPIAPRGIYANGKAACEAQALARGGVVARLSNLFGPGMARNTLIADVLAQIPGHGPLQLRDDAPVRDYVWIEDAARAIVACATLPVSGILNIGSAIGTSAGTLARIALGLAGEAERPVIATAASSRVSHLVLDITQTQEKLSWTPRMSLAGGLSQISKLKSAA